VFACAACPSAPPSPAVIQFEDFSSDKAADILEAYRYDHLSFNDDIQGACPAVSGRWKQQGGGSSRAEA
jgi:hypothetical protein